MIEIIIQKYLQEHLDVPVHHMRPSNPPKKYVLFERTSGQKKNHLQTATVAFQSYGSSFFEALSLNENVKETVEKMVTLDSVAGVALNSDYNFTDTETKEYRYQAVFDINYY